jgi:chromate reductase
MQYHLRMCMTYLGCDIFGLPEVFVMLAQTKFDKDTLKLTDEATRKIVAQQLEGFAKYIERVKA